MSIPLVWFSILAIIASGALSISLRAEGERMESRRVERVRCPESMSWKITTATKTFVMLPMPKMCEKSIGTEVWRFDCPATEDHRGVVG